MAKKPSFSDRFWRSCLSGRKQIDIQTAFNTAAMEGRIWRVEYLLLNNKKIDINNNDGHPLRWASYCGRLDMVKYLLNNGADIHAKDDGAVIFAAKQNKVEVLSYLLKNKANIHAQNDEALKIAAEKGHHKMVEFLLDHGVTDRSSRTEAWERAKENKHEAVQQVLGNWAMRYDLAKKPPHLP